MSLIQQTPLSTVPPTAPTPDLILHQAEQADRANKHSEALQLYTQFILSAPATPSNDHVLKQKEQVILRSSQLIGNPTDLAAFIRALEPAWLAFPRAKTAKIIRLLLDLFQLDSPLLLALLNDLIVWCTKDRRFYLKQTLQIKLAAVYFACRRFSEALEGLGELSRELRKLDDKVSLVEVYLLESRVFFALKASAKAKASLTASRTASNAVYCSPLLLAQMDLMSALLHAEEEDYGTALSYLIESLDGYLVGMGDRGVHADGIDVLRYMLMCKVMLGEDASTLDTLLVNTKSAKPYLPMDIRDFKSIAEAHKEGSLKQFQIALHAHTFNNDQIIISHLNKLYDTLLEKNLLQLIKPYSCLPLSVLASELKLDLTVIEQKLCQMILDRSLSAVIDQSDGGYLIILKESKPDPVYTAALQTIRNLDGVVEALYAKARSIQ